MATWLMIQIIIGIVLFVFWSIVAMFRSSKSGYPFNAKDVFKLIYAFFFPVSYLMILSLMGIAMNGKMFFSASHLLIPLVISIYLGLVLITYQKQKFVEKKKEQHMLLKKQECIKWFERFSFADENRIEIRLYKSGENIKGKLIVKKVTNEEEEELKANRKFLPENISLLIFKKKVMNVS